MARMQDVEAAVRQHDALAARLRLGDEGDELRQLDEAAAAAALRVQRMRELRAAHRRHADLTDDDAGAEIRERRGVGGREAGGDAGTEQGDDGIAGTGHVEHFASHGRERERLGSLLEQRHPLLAARHEQHIELELRAQRLALPQQIGFVRAMADDGFELAAIRR
jgi:hypothetical protein